MRDDLQTGAGEADAFAALHEHDLLKLFEKLSFREKWTRVMAGLKRPRESGANKWARLQVQRLMAPVMAVIVPFLMLGLITLFARFGPTPTTTVQVKVIDPEPMERLEEIEEPAFEPPPPEPMDMQVEFTIDAPAMPADVAAPPAEAASVAPAAFDSVALVKSPVIMRGMLGSRSPGARGQALKTYGGNAETEAAVMRALRWLKKHQKADGSWSGNAGGYSGRYNAQPEPLTAIALLTFLAHGETPASEEFGDTVQRSIEWLIARQRPNGFFTTAGEGGYTHPIVSYALCEAASIIRIPPLREAARKALEYLLKGQGADGGFRYACAPQPDMDRVMCSLSSWCVQAMKAATIGGLGDQEVLAKALERTGHAFRTRIFLPADGTFMYHTLPSYRGSFKPLTSAAVLCLMLINQHDTPEARRGMEWIHQNATMDWQKPWGDSPVYYWYYTTQVMFHVGGDAWTRWNKMLISEVAGNQTIEAGQGADGKDIGYWTAPREAGGYDGKNHVYNTALCALMLQVYYRYLPTFKVIPRDEIQRELGDEADLEIEII